MRLHRKNARRLNHAAVAAAVAARLGLRARLGPVPLHVSHAFVALELDGLRGAGGRLEQVERHVARGRRCPRRGGRRARPPPKMSPNRPSPKMSPKAWKMSPTSWKCGAPPPVQPGVTVAVVARPLVGDAQDLEGLGGLLEPGDRLFVAGIAVGMIFQRQFAVGLGDLVRLAERSSTPSTS